MAAVCGHCIAGSKWLWSLEVGVKENLEVLCRWCCRKGDPRQGEVISLSRRVRDQHPGRLNGMEFVRDEHRRWGSSGENSPELCILVSLSLLLNTQVLWVGEWLQVLQKESLKRSSGLQEAYLLSRIKEYYKFWYSINLKYLAFKKKLVNLCN